ncbi:MAG: glycoside hydrolase family 2 [Sphingobacteriaceae bacterium]|nr:MAG: glycoside hydrolase family 2 [Sphingobacteriaceae bacterium]
MPFLKKSLLILLCFYAVNTYAQQRKITSFQEIRNVFAAAPDSIQTSVYWYWISGNISKEGVVKDLQSMKKIGINRAFIGNIGLGEPYGKVKIFSVEWWEILHTALKTATELNIQIGLFNGPGWSQSGGPWIKPEQSMRYLTSSQTVVKGGKMVDIMLPKPNAQFQDERVIAYPQTPVSRKAKLTLAAQPALTGLANLQIIGNNTAVNFDKGGHQQIDFDFDAEQPAQSLTIWPARQKIFAKAKLQAFVNGSFTTIREFDIDRQNDALNVGFEPYAPVVVSFAEVKTKKYRLLLSGYSGEIGITGLDLSAVPKVERYPEKTLAKMFPTPLPYWNEYQWPVQPVISNSACTINPAKVIDITSNMTPEGRLRWKAPKGNWIVVRTGMTSTLVTNSPAEPLGTGLEVDKMSKKHVAAHFEAFMGEVLKRIPAADRKTLKVVVEDSYETGGQNWTDDFIADFKTVYHYDPVVYLPVFRGEVVGSQEQSDRFLWDVRRLIADNVAYKYVGGLRDVSNKYGLTTWLENYGHWGFPGEFLQYGGQSDEIGGEFWSEGDLGNIENRAASSAAHIYGKTKVSAESFTAGGFSYGRYPAMMKQRGDRFFAEGINNTLLHVFISQPDDKLPGTNAFFGNEFNRKNTWYYDMDDFVKYLKRTNYILQQGLYVADVAYFIGEDAPKMTGVQDPALPKGYSFDYINGEVIKQRLMVKNDRFVLPDGMSYKVLVLPKLETMRPELLAKIAELVKQGGVVFGPKPLRSPSLQGYPEADNKLKKLADELWGENPALKFVRPYGAGFVMNGPDLQAALDYVKTTPDVVLNTNGVEFLHRKLNNADVYFVTNQSSKKVTFNPAFKVTGKQPELWDATNATSRDLPEYSVNNGYTTVPLELDVNESVFIVFNKPINSAAAKNDKNFAPPSRTIPLAGAWNVQFNKNSRGPEKPVTFKSLVSWTDVANDSVKYYSGSAIYTKKFKFDGLRTGQKVYIDLGTVTAVAKIKVNGINVGGVWTPPYRTDISKALRRGQNTIEIKVTNNWMNRLIGDSKLPAEQRQTWTSFNPFNAESSLQPSGLLGPVNLNIY